MKVKLKKGKKGLNDNIIILYLEPNTLDGGEQIYDQHLLEILDLRFKNEDNIYSNGLGGNYLLSAILDIRYQKGTIEDICRKHKLSYIKKK